MLNMAVSIGRKILKQTSQFKPASPSNLPQADALQEQRGDTNGMPKGQDQSASTALPRQTLGLLADMLLEIPFACAPPQAADCQT